MLSKELLKVKAEMKLNSREWLYGQKYKKNCLSVALS